jgi:hypothetical protein
MLIQTQPGLPGARQVGQGQNAPGGTFAEVLVSELNPVYYQLLKAGKVFALAQAAVNPTAFSGGAAGTPLIGLYNPPSSGVDLVMLQARVGLRATGTAAASSALNFYAVQQGATAPTGTQTAPRNMYSQALTGSQAYAMANTANTGALASNLIAPSISLQALATAAQNVSLLVDDIKGAIIVPPGGYLAYGLVAALTAGSIDSSLIWAEIPA